MKVACITPDDLSTIIFCKTLSRILKELGGFEVWSISPVYMHGDELALIDTHHVEVPMERYISPVDDIKYFYYIYKTIRHEKFDAVITFTTKPNIYGVLAARLAGVQNITLAVRGLGRVFNKPQNFREVVTSLIVSRLYRLACKASAKVWFTNRNDRDYFLSNTIAPAGKVFMTKNAIDLSEYSKSCILESRMADLRQELKLSADHRVVVMVARMIWPKGIREYAEAAQLLRDRLPKLWFLLVAPLETDSPQAVPEEYIRQIESTCNLSWLGFRKDVRDLYGLAELAVLPSYYKEGGYPRALLEPMGLEKPVIAADTEDCKNPVDSGKNGYIVPPRDSHALANAIEKIMSDESRRLEFGQHSYQKVISEFDDKLVMREVLEKTGIVASKVQPAQCQ